MTDTCTIRGKYYVQGRDAIPAIPAIEPCEAYPDGVPAEPEQPAVLGYWMVDCIVDMYNGTRTGTECVYLPETATDEEIQTYIINMYMLMYNPPEEA